MRLQHKNCTILSKRQTPRINSCFEQKQTHTHIVWCTMVIFSLRCVSHCFAFSTHTKSNGITLKPPLLLVTHDIHHIPNKWWINAQIKCTIENWMKNDLIERNFFFDWKKKFWIQKHENIVCFFPLSFYFRNNFFPWGCCEHPCSLVIFFCQFVGCIFYILRGNCSKSSKEIRKYAVGQRKFGWKFIV